MTDWFKLFVSERQYFDVGLQFFFLAVCATLWLRFGRTCF